MYFCSVIKTDMSHKRIRPKVKPSQKDGYIAFKRGRDNRGYYNGDGNGDNAKKIRVPSLKASDRVWANFYRLFPRVLGMLLDDNTDKEIAGNVITVRRIAAANGKKFRVRMCKYKKIW